jgi:23S rRNA pseudouridine2605 synthase
MQERVQKILSQWGVASRRHAETLILEGRVQINGQVAQLGQKADPVRDCIEVNGKPVQPWDRPQPVYILLNKPLGVLSTCRDPQSRKTALDCLPSDLCQSSGIHPVGRLDADSTGVLLLTNDGDLTFYLTHPRHHIPKTYEVWVKGFPEESILLQWRQGVILDRRKTLPAKVKVLRRGAAKTLLEIVLTEGRNRQIRRVAELLGHPVIRLHRSAIGSIRLHPPGQPLLPSGGYRPLTQMEIDYLKSRIDLISIRPTTEVKE